MADDIRVVVDITRLDALQRAIAGGALEQALQASAFEVESIAKQLAPVDTGALRASIFTHLEGGGAEATATVGPTVDYGLYQEYGTGVMPAHPFLRPALEQVKPRLAIRVRDIVNRLAK